MSQAGGPQPRRGRSTPPGSRRVEALHEHELEGLGLIVGGRSAGARVACRTAQRIGALAVLCLAFPLQPPARRGKAPSPDRLDELEQVTVPVLAVQGERDRFGIPPAAAGREVAIVPGDHSLRTDPEAVANAVGNWLVGLVSRTPAARR